MGICYRYRGEGFSEKQKAAKKQGFVGKNIKYFIFTL
ncbi:hypothetical protein MgSA37_01019 [Mucilaginibacter gotjawali]|uniref:Uncharacterized protein n=2 Tax=Mucilaginibacter gotjawali TaxID=1550579 RepID=A0A120MYC8_9SPHI|nr:hypothetical protein [Mucilaginibacter gotjawali]BAU52855.1 hypothetical protein MgSA37_01019 [Mucilaginibacter gotjawali]